MGTHDRKAGLITTNSRLALTLERTINNQDGPAGSGPSGFDADPPAVKVEILDLVTDILQSRAGRAEPEIHVGKITVLRNMEADSDGRGIAGSDLDIDIAHGAVERAGAAVPRGAFAPAESAPSREEQHILLGSFLETRGILAQGKFRSGVAIADQTHAGPNVNGFCEPVRPFRDEQHSSSGARRDLVNRLLQR